jgi:hypothetical protein
MKHGKWSILFTRRANYRKNKPIFRSDTPSCLKILLAIFHHTSMIA